MIRSTIPRINVEEPSHIARLHVDHERIKSRRDGQIKAIEEKEDNKLMNKSAGVVFIILAILGIITGFFLSRQMSSDGALFGSSTSKKPTLIKTDKVAGISDTKTFKDSAIGVIEKGGVSGEGTHKLIRDGGPSQTVYMISSVVDLDEYIGKKVTVWGETMAAKKVSWLMDVGKVELQ